MHKELRATPPIPMPKELDHEKLPASSNLDTRCPDLIPRSQRTCHLDAYSKEEPTHGGIALTIQHDSPKTATVINDRLQKHVHKNP
jgi:hypothetical protein